MKEMIHGIHASAVRTTDYEHVRNRNNGLYYNWSEVTFPTDAGNCLVCHIDATEDFPATYQLPLVENVLMTVNRTTGVADGKDATQADVTTARENVPNDTDWVFTPATGACYSCHDSGEAVAHMTLNGGAIDQNRSAVLAGGTVETCAVCHGAGSSHAVDKVHTIVSF
jgi:OmcA/MtrC family decaheme c-type cytochrome